MTHDYSQYDDNDKVELNFRAVCNTCGWENRRAAEVTVVNSKNGHERYNEGHGVKIEEVDNE